MARAIHNGITLGLTSAEAIALKTMLGRMSEEDYKTHLSTARYIGKDIDVEKGARLIHGIFCALTEEENVNI